MHIMKIHMKHLKRLKMYLKYQIISKTQISYLLQKIYTNNKCKKYIIL